MTAKVIPSAASFKKKKKVPSSRTWTHRVTPEIHKRETLSIKPPNLCHICASPRVYLFILSQPQLASWSLTWRGGAELQTRTETRCHHQHISSGTEVSNCRFSFFKKKNLPGLALPQNRINKKKSSFRLSCEEWAAQYQVSQQNPSLQRRLQRMLLLPRIPARTRFRWLKTRGKLSGTI